jgi:hypothetical protein
VHGRKNSESRTTPINPAMHELCARLLKDRREPRDPKRRGKGYLLKLTECREAEGDGAADDVLGLAVRIPFVDYSE